MISKEKEKQISKTLDELWKYNNCVTTERVLAILKRKYPAKYPNTWTFLQVSRYLSHNIKYKTSENKTYYWNPNINIRCHILRNTAYALKQENIEITKKILKIALEHEGFDEKDLLETVDEFLSTLKHIGYNKENHKVYDL